MFSVPAVLGMPAGFNVATTEIYQLLESYPPRIADATAWGVLLLLISALLILAQAALLRRRSFITITGKAFRPNRQPPRARWLRAAVAWLYIALATALPLIALLWAASSAFVTTDARLVRFTARHFVYVLFDYPKTWLAAGNSVLLGVLTATLVSVLSLAVSWVVLRTHQRGRDLLDQLSMLPLSMPAMVFALGLLWVYVEVPLPIYGTIVILLIAYATHYLPFGVRSTSAALHQLHPELEEAARVAGASWFRTMRLVTLAAGAAHRSRGLGAAVRHGDAGGQFLHPAVHQPQHRAVRRRVRSVGERQSQRRGCVGLPPTHGQLRHRRRRAWRPPAAGAGMSGAVAVEALIVSHGSVAAVRDISFVARPGEVLTLLGPSGCGKTTTLRAIAGLETPLQGRIAIGGRTVFDATRGDNLPPERRGLSMVFQSYAIWPHMTVFENVAFGLRARGIARSDLQVAVQRSLDLVGLALSPIGRPRVCRGDSSNGSRSRVPLPAIPP